MAEPIEHSQPWQVAERGWRVESVSSESDRREFEISVTEAALSEPMRFACGVAAECLVFRVTLEGRGAWIADGHFHDVLPLTTLALDLSEDAMLECRHEAGRHRFVVFRFAKDYLKRLLGSGGEGLRDGLSGVFGAKRLSGEHGFALGEPVTALDRNIAESIVKSPSSRAGAPLWVRAKAIEFLSHWCYRENVSEDEQFFCSRQKRTVMERVQKAKNYLREHIDEPLELAAVARAAACSAHYLSRLFSAETGMTLSRYLRAMRIDRAEELLASGAMNVSEAALEVGYQSLSHFAIAFKEEKGLAPSEFVARLES